MILTGKAKEDFELYLTKEYGKFEVDVFQECASAPQYPIYLDEVNLPETVENTLIVEWLDSVDNINGTEFYFQEILMDCFNDGFLNTTLYKINKQAIIKANEIYNTFFGE